MKTELQALSQFLDLSHFIDTHSVKEGEADFLEERSHYTTKNFF